MQNLIVAVIVAAAIAYAAWRFMPTAMKQKLARMFGASESQAQKLGSAGACGSCNSCKACVSPAEKSGQSLYLHK